MVRLAQPAAWRERQRGCGVSAAYGYFRAAARSAGGLQESAYRRELGRRAASPADALQKYDAVLRPRRRHRRHTEQQSWPAWTQSWSRLSRSRSARVAAWNYIGWRARRSFQRWANGVCAAGCG